MKKLVTTKLINSDHSSEKLATSVLSILEANELCGVATVSPSGESHIHTAYFCYTDSMDLFFISNPATRHSQNLAKNPSAAVAVASSSQPWDQPHRGLQLFGNCSVAGLTATAKALAVHAARFHAYRDYLQSLNPADLKALVYKFYVFRPSRITIFDEPEFGEETFVIAEVVRD